MGKIIYFYLLFDGDFVRKICFVCGNVLFFPDISGINWAVMAPTSGDAIYIALDPPKKEEKESLIEPTKKLYFLLFYYQASDLTSIFALTICFEKWLLMWDNFCLIRNL